MQRSVLLAALLPGLVQAQFGPPQAISVRASLPERIVVADLNGDGVDDVLVAAYYGPSLMWYPATGSGTFEEPEIIVGTLGGSGSCDAADMDGDGDLDVAAVGQGPGAVVWYRNDGGGNFGPQRSIGNLATPTWVQAVDLDADGLVDVIVPNYDQHQLVLYRNLGNGQFSDTPLITELGFPLMTASGDLDGDGDVDLAYATDVAMGWCANNGDGTFGTPMELSTMDYRLNVSVTDLDGDGYLDILGGTSTFDIRWFKNNGLGEFTTRTITGTIGASLNAIHATDFDADGDLDVLATTDFLNILAWFPNNGSGVFGAHQLISAGTDHPTAVVGTDTDDDGDMDILVSGLTAQRFDHYTNEGGGEFDGPLSLAPSGAEDPVRSLTADINGDGVRDVVVVSTNDGKVYWFAKAADGSTGPRQVAASVGAVSFTHALDADEDGDIDLVSITTNGALGLSVNDGTGVFEPWDFFESVPSLHDLASGDVDLDGDEDLLYGMVDANGLRVAINNGDGTFDLPAVDDASASRRSGSLLVDVDDDGDLDVVHGDATEDRYEWYANGGTGAFGPVQVIGPVLVSTINALLWNDINGDGLNDLVAATDTDDRIVWFPNAGGGSFGSEQSLLTLDAPRGVAIADLDGDGDLDIAATAWSDGEAHYALNNGSGVFGTPLLVAEGPNGPAHLVADDMDGDGDPDLIVTFDEDDRVNWYENYFGSPYRMEGTLYHDLDADGSYDAGEPGAAWFAVHCEPFSSIPLTDPDGGFVFLVEPAEYVITALGENPLWQISTLPAAYEVSLTAADPVATGLDLGITAVVDTSVIIPSLTVAAGVCSEEGNQWISFANLGTRIEHGRVELDLDPLFEFNSATPTPDVVNGAHLEWDFDQLTYEEVRGITLSVTRPSADFIGDTLNALLTVLRMDGLDNVTDTFTFAWSEVILCSYDPNDKLVTPRGVGNVGVIDIATPYLDYTIRFQNTGAAPAQDVVVRDPIDPSVDKERIEILGYSHQPTGIAIEADGEMVVRFDGIDLPDSAADLLGSQGYITFRAHLVEGLPHTTCVENRALIFFDLNEPVVTNSVVNTLVDCSLHTASFDDLGEGQLVASEGISYQWYHNGVAVTGATDPSYQAWHTGYYAVTTTNVYHCVAQSEAVFVSDVGIQEHALEQLRVVPNPVRHQAVLLSNAPLHVGSTLEVVDTHGRILFVTRGTGAQTAVLDVSLFPAGLYVLRVTGAHGKARSLRFVVE